MSDEEIKKEDEPVEETTENPSYMDVVKNFNPCGGNVQDYSNPTAAIAISTAATALIAAGMSQISINSTVTGTTLVLIGCGIYFVKAYLMKKNCL